MSGGTLGCIPTVTASRTVGAREQMDVQAPTWTLGGRLGNGTGTHFTITAATACCVVEVGSRTDPPTTSCVRWSGHPYHRCDLGEHGGIHGAISLLCHSSDRAPYLVPALYLFLGVMWMTLSGYRIPLVVAARVEPDLVHH